MEGIDLLFKLCGGSAPDLPVQMVLFLEWILKAERKPIFVNFKDKE